MDHLKLGLTLLLTTALAGPALCEGPDTWTQWRGPARDGHVSDQWPASLTDSLRLSWEKPHAPTYSGPVLAGELLFTTETIDRTSERVTAYSLSSGDVRWSAQWPGSMAVPPFAYANGDWIRSTPACTQTHLCVLGMRDVMVCLDVSTGEELWRNDFPNSMKTPLPSFGAVCSPLIDGQAVYVQTGGALVKLDLNSGQVLWKALENGAGMMSSGAFSSPVIAELHGVRQLVVATRQELCGVDLNSGNVLWTQPIESFRGMNILTPLVAGNQIFTSAHSGKAQLFDVAHSDGNWQIRERWSQKSQGYMSSPILVGDTIYLHMKNQRVSALSLADGSVKWTSRPYGKYWSMVTNGERILALDNTGELLLIEPDDQELKVVDSMKVANDAWAHLAVRGDQVIVRDLAAIKVFSWTK